MYRLYDDVVTRELENVDKNQKSNNKSNGEYLLCCTLESLVYLLN